MKKNKEKKVYQVIDECLKVPKGQSVINAKYILDAIRTEIEIKSTID